MSPRRTRLVALLGVALSSCTVIQRDFGDPTLLDTSSFVVGASTLEEVVGTLGPPVAISALPEGSALLYEGARVLELQIGIGLLRYFKLAVGRGVADREIVTLTFDREGRLSSRAEDGRSENLGTGGSFQIAFAVKSVVETEQLERALAPGDWGTALLGSVSRQLNRRSDLHTATSGVEQAGTTTGVGQHVLDWEDR